MNVRDDVLRGLIMQHEYDDIVLPFTVFRRIDCVLDHHKDEVFNIYEKFRAKVEDPIPLSFFG